MIISEDVKVGNAKGNAMGSTEGVAIGSAEGVVLGNAEGVGAVGSAKGFAPL